MTELHASLRDIPMPDRMRALQLTEKGFPALFFAGEVDGKIDLRCADSAKWLICVKQKKCWLCGQPLGRFLCWPIGPMCVVNLVSSEPPSHRDCSDYAVRACPFLTRPHARRRTAGLPEGVSMPGIGIERNPGVTALWTARDYKPFRVDGGKGWLIQLGDPLRVDWYAEGRTATPEEILASIASGLPLLEDMARQQGEEAMRELNDQINAARCLIPELATQETTNG